MRDDDMLDLLILFAIVGFGFGLGYGVRELISRRRRQRHRFGDRSLGPNAASPKPDVRPAEPASDVSINLDRLLAAANDDRAGRQQPRRPEPPNVQENRRDDDDVAVRALLVELNRLSTHEQAPPDRANFENLGQNRERVSR
jgi:hypothetical protein